MVYVLLRFQWLSKHHTGTIKLNYILSPSVHACSVCACLTCVCVCVCVCVCPTCLYADPSPHLSLCLSLSLSVSVSVSLSVCLSVSLHSPYILLYVNHITARTLRSQPLPPPTPTTAPSKQLNRKVGLCG